MPSELAPFANGGRHDGLAGSDHRLVVAAAERLGVPRESVPAERDSFVLHAPLELLARAALLPAVAPDAREPARGRIEALVTGYEHAAPALAAASAATGNDSVEGAVGDLADAIAAEDAPEVDAIATWLDTNAAPADIARHMAPVVLPSLAAAGHANIYLTLLARSRLLGASTKMLRSLARSLAIDVERPLRVPTARILPDTDGTVGRRLLQSLASVEPIGPPPVPFIAPLVHHAEDHHVLDSLMDGGDVFLAPDRVAVEILRFAAHAMLQGPPEHAPLGWTHCLTLAQGALAAGGYAGDHGSGTYVAAAYLAAHWGAYGRGTLDLGYAPEPTSVSINDAMYDSPATAATAAWYGDDTDHVVGVLATAASIHHDAHRVKYTLACFDAAAADPGARPLYLAAAAYLNAWWFAYPDRDDPTDDQRAAPEVTIRWHEGPRTALRPLFELAEDSQRRLDSYIDDGRVLVAYAEGPEPVGHLQLVATHRAHVAELKSLAVWPSHTRRGIGRRLVEHAVEVCEREHRTELIVATAAADVDNLRFYQRLGFRLIEIEPDAFVPAHGYPPGMMIDGIPLRDGVWLSRSLVDRDAST